MRVAAFDLDVCTCAVVASEAVHKAMWPYVRPFRTRSLRQPQVVITVGYGADVLACSQRPHPAAVVDDLRPSHPTQRYEVFADGQQEILTPEGSADHLVTVRGEHIYVAAESPRLAATVATRILRQLVMRGSEARGGRSVHAGAVEVGGAGVLIGGRSGAGKTSVVTWLMERHGARPIANDRCALVRVDNNWRAIGVPLAWRYTPEGVDGSARLRAAVDTNRPIRGRDLVDGKVELTPGEVSHVFRRPSRAAVSLSRIVVLVHDTGHGEATPNASIISGHLDFGDRDDFAHDWLRVRPSLAGDHGRFGSPGDEWWEELAAAIPTEVHVWSSPDEFRGIAATIARRAGA